MNQTTAPPRAQAAVDLLRGLVQDIRDATDTPRGTDDRAAAIAAIRDHVAPVCACALRDDALVLAATVLAEHEWDGDLPRHLHPAGRKRRHLEVVTSHA